MKINEDHLDVRAATLMHRQIRDAPNDLIRVVLLRLFAVKHAGVDPKLVAETDDETILGIYTSVTPDLDDDIGSPVVDLAEDRR